MMQAADSERQIVTGKLVGYLGTARYGIISTSLSFWYCVVNLLYNFVYTKIRDRTGQGWDVPSRPVTKIQDKTIETSILRRSTHRSPKVETSIFEGGNIDLRKSKHRSSKVDTSIFEGRNVDLRRSKCRSSNVETSIFEDRRWKHRTDNHLRSSKVETSHRQFTTEYCPQRRSIQIAL